MPSLAHLQQQLPFLIADGSDRQARLPEHLQLLQPFVGFDCRQGNRTCKLLAWLHPDTCPLPIGAVRLPGTRYLHDADGRLVLLAMIEERQVAWLHFLEENSCRIVANPVPLGSAILNEI